jgi:senataxin
VTSNGAHPQQRQIRPGLKRPNSSSASAVLAEARARAAAKKEPENSQKSEAEVIEINESPILQRKTKASDPSRLANLVRNVAAAPTGDEAMQSTAFASNVTPSDFWKNIREWDFVSDLVKINNDKDETVITARKPIPDTFISFRHYISLWAPLCLAETRAQMVSELMTSSNQQGSKAKLFIEVEAETTWKSGGRKDRNLHSDLTDIDSCSVRLGTKERNTGAGQFFANDVFCLIPVEHRDTVELLLNGKKFSGYDGSFNRFCIVGHTEVQSKYIDGLILKVSKRKWAQMGTSTMYLLRIGANITALREFTALCGVENIPLKRYLLGHHLSEKGKQDGASRASTTALCDANSMRKEVMLKQMGGVQALGKGFTDYAKKKFNPSQLMAISASSTGYGEGEFFRLPSREVRAFFG